MDSQGNKTAVQLSITDWETIVSEAMKELKNPGGNPQKAKWLDSDAVKNE